MKNGLSYQEAHWLSFNLINPENPYQNLNNFTRVITAHGLHRQSGKPLNPDKWDNKPNYIEINH